MTVSGTTYTSTRVRGLAPWSPRQETVDVLLAVQGVLDEYRAYLPMTARQIFYRLVGSQGYDKTEKAYKRLLEYLNRARRAGMLPWAAIRDDGFEHLAAGGWDSPESFIAHMVSWAEDYDRDHQEGQAFYTEIWVEAAGMVPQVGQMVSDYSIPIYSSGGFNSVTAKYETARRFARRYTRDDLTTRILHVGDYDPSGVAIIDSLADDIWAMIADQGYDERAVARFVRVAITPEQIEELNLPGAPAKHTDRRGDFSDLTVQAEALAPPQLEAILLDEIREEWDQDAFDELIEQETEERQRLLEQLRDLDV